MKTGNTAGRMLPPIRAARASMEPGHEDREYLSAQWCLDRANEASMEPGHEDREYSPPLSVVGVVADSLNGARS